MKRIDDKCILSVKKAIHSLTTMEKMQNFYFARKLNFKKNMESFI